MTCGIPMIAAVSIYSVEGLAGMGGRVAFGLLGDRFGAKRVLVAGLLLQAFGVLAYVFVSELGGFYAVAALVGFIYAGVMPLYAVLARENFPLRMMGTVIGGTAMAGSLGMATGPLAGGLIYDSLRQLRLALCRLLGHRHRRLPDRHDLQALPQGASQPLRQPRPRRCLREHDPTPTGSGQEGNSVTDALAPLQLLRAPGEQFGSRRAAATSRSMSDFGDLVGCAQTKCAGHEAIVGC